MDLLFRLFKRYKALSPLHGMTTRHVVRLGALDVRDNVPGSAYNRVVSGLRPSSNSAKHMQASQRDSLRVIFDEYDLSLTSRVSRYNAGAPLTVDPTAPAAADSQQQAPDYALELALAPLHVSLDQDTLEFLEAFARDTQAVFDGPCDKTADVYDKDSAAWLVSSASATQNDP